MAALTKERDTKARAGETIALGAAASVTLYAGALAALDGNGNAAPGAAATSLRGLGRVKKTVDNSSGSAGDEVVEIEKGIFRFANSAGADEVTAADIGSDCWIVDDQSVAKTDGSGTRSVAGRVFDLDARGVWVKFD
ncbi:MAG: hypothetical protein CSA20_08460 [Deltaproteobacteria bacterium]|nr:MAG: hypothetical protein CSA20_08460 [Deltaproteobacteria bacterium]